MYANYVLFICCYIFYICDLVVNDITLELYLLVRNMNWLDGYAWIWHWHGCGFKLWRTQIKLCFCYFGFGLNLKG